MKNPGYGNPETESRLVEAGTGNDCLMDTGFPFGVTKHFGARKR